MRLAAALLTAASLLAPAAHPSAVATRRSIPVPFAGCSVTLETNDFSFQASQRGAAVQRWGDNSVTTNC